MSEKKEILHREDIKKLVDHFYEKVRSDNYLSPIFNGRIRDQWPVHLEKMYRFWETILLGEHSYMGLPFPPHASLGIDHSHFQQWLHLFHEAVDELFTGEKAKEAKWRADKMAMMFEARLRDIKEQGFKSIL
jgi:hemoglobin